MRLAPSSGQAGWAVPVPSRAFFTRKTGRHAASRRETVHTVRARGVWSDLCG
ncbi:hypothetical protein ACFPM0_08190 [Pseudonocardia sulfidoxydans]|uniref:hypothetical protein n=1 Tax=Pseudonocardia sulfidoxydans TaxID=54011 RepID=UPI00361E2C4F